MSGPAQCHTHLHYQTDTGTDNLNAGAHERMHKCVQRNRRKLKLKFTFSQLIGVRGAPIVVLKEKEGDSNRILLIWIGESEAAAIQMHLENVELPRPMTHDST